jgi:hypothetical protein
MSRHKSGMIFSILVTSPIVLSMRLVSVSLLPRPVYTTSAMVRGSPTTDMHFSTIPRSSRSLPQWPIFFELFHGNISLHRCNFLPAGHHSKPGKRPVVFRHTQGWYELITSGSLEEIREGKMEGIIYKFTGIITRSSKLLINYDT